MAFLNTGLCLSVALLSAACSSGSGGNNDASHDYLTFDYVFGDLPPGCPPAAANDKGVGAACTKGGGECKNNLVCACETTLGIVPPEGTPCICTLLIPQSCANIPADYCGQDAICCGYMDIAAICVPTVCLDTAMCPAI